MERTSALPWMRGRFASFEIALLAGVRNLLLDSAEDEARGRNKESRAAHYTFLYGIFTSLRYLFFWYALQARLSDVCAEAARPPEMEDAERIMAELEIFNSAAVRADVQAGLRAALDEGTGLDDIRRRVTEQARVYDLLNTSKEMPKA